MNIFKIANINRTYPFSMENTFCSFFPQPEIDYLHLIEFHSDFNLHFTLVLIDKEAEFSCQLSVEPQKYTNNETGANLINYYIYNH